MAPGEGPHSTNETNYPKRPHLDLTPTQPCFSWGRPWTLGHGPRPAPALLRSGAIPGCFPASFSRGTWFPPPCVGLQTSSGPKLPITRCHGGPGTFVKHPLPEETFWMPCDKCGVQPPKLKYANRFQTAGWPGFNDFEAFWYQSRAPTSAFV